MMDRRQCEELAKDLLKSTSVRKGVLVGLSIVMVLGVVVGTAVIDEWLKESVPKFAIYWGIYMLFVCFVALFCVYDILRKLRER